MKTYSYNELTNLEKERYEQCVKDFGNQGYLYLVTENCLGAGYEIMYSTVCLDNSTETHFDADKMRYITDVDEMLNRF